VGKRFSQFTWLIGKWAEKETRNSGMLAVLGGKERSTVETCGFVLV
jgi:hypothetical protein